MKSMTSIMKWSSYFLISTSALVAQDTIAERNEKLKQVEQFFQIAEKAYEQGDLKAATEAIRSTLEMNPKHGRAIALYREIKSGGGNRALVTLRKRTFSKVIVPLVDFQDMDVRGALTMLSDAVLKETNEKVIPNFVIQDRHKYFDKVEIDLKLRNVPAGDVLNHILSEANATAKFEKYSTVIRSRSSGVKKDVNPKVDLEKSLSDPSSDE